MNKIGLGITTYQRFKNFKECFENVMRNIRDVEEVVIVDDGSVVDKELYDAYFEQLRFNNIIVKRHTKNLGVAKSKNAILKYFYDKNYDYIFTLEDDINIVSPDVFKAYIDASNSTGIQHFNFAHHGPANVGITPTLKFDGLVECYPHIVGAFSFYTHTLLSKIGFMDEVFYNAWEHVDFTYRASITELTTPFWTFADIKDSKLLLQEQPNSIRDSSIRPRKDWSHNVNSGLDYWKLKHGFKLLESVPQ